MKDKLTNTAHSSSIVIEAYYGHLKRKRLILYILCCLLALVMMIGMSLGAMSISLKEVAFALVDPLYPTKSLVSSQIENIVWNVRFPRLARHQYSGSACGSNCSFG